MSNAGPGPRRRVLKIGLALAAGCLTSRPGRAQPADSEADNEYAQPKLDRSYVKYQLTPGPDDHYCGVYTNFIAPNHCRVVDGEISPGGYCLSFAPKDIDIP